MSRNKVVNIINFVRGVEPRGECDLYTPVVEEIKLIKKYGFENTFLLQYDAMMREDLVELLRQEKDEHMEVGVWIEMARCLVERAGISWRSERGWDWDWFVNPGFLLAYTKEEKERIIDLIMEKFKSLFGYYPKSAGSWMLDSDSVTYMTEKYGLEAFCICREQWGTDAYTLWGGYYNGPYYPSRNNILNPAQTPEQQINSPVIRMLGPDPIYCYFEKRSDYSGIDEHFFTLEPSLPTGHSDKWVNWYFYNFMENEDMGCNYTHVGQENSFGWESIKKGLPMQLALLNKLVQEDKVHVEKMCDTGRRFKEQYDMTPATVYSALDDWSEYQKQSVWYSCKNYRLNVYTDENGVWFRDLQKFDENYRDVYLDHPCECHDAIQDALPVVDGQRFSDKETRSGMYFGQGKIEKTWREGELFCVLLTVDNKKIVLEISEDRIGAVCDKDFTVKFTYKQGCEQIKNITKDKVNYEHNGVKYALCMEEGFIKEGCLVSESGKLSFKLD